MGFSDRMATTLKMQVMNFDIGLIFNQHNDHLLAQRPSRPGFQRVIHPNLKQKPVPLSQLFTKMRLQKSAISLYQP